MRGRSLATHMSHPFLRRNHCHTSPPDAAAWHRCRRQRGRSVTWKGSISVHTTEHIPYKAAASVYSSPPARRWHRRAVPYLSTPPPPLVSSFPHASPRYARWLERLSLSLSLAEGTDGATEDFRERRLVIRSERRENGSFRATGFREKL